MHCELLQVSGSLVVPCSPTTITLFRNHYFQTFPYWLIWISRFCEEKKNIGFDKYPYKKYLCCTFSSFRTDMGSKIFRKNVICLRSPLTIYWRRPITSLTDGRQSVVQVVVDKLTPRHHHGGKVVIIINLNTINRPHYIIMVE